VCFKFWFITECEHLGIDVAFGSPLADLKSLYDDLKSQQKTQSSKQTKLSERIKATKAKVANAAGKLSDMFSPCEVKNGEPTLPWDATVVCKTDTFPAVVEAVAKMLLKNPIGKVERYEAADQALLGQ